MNPDGNNGAKALMVGISLAAGAIVFFLLTFKSVPRGEFLGSECRFQSNLVFTGSCAACACAFAYPFVGAIVIVACSRLRSWANMGHVQTWDDGDRLVRGAFWPATLLISLVLYPFLGVIHRVF